VSSEPDPDEPEPDPLEPDPLEPDPLEPDPPDPPWSSEDEGEGVELGVLGPRLPPWSSDDDGEGAELGALGPRLPPWSSPASVVLVPDGRSPPWSSPGSVVRVPDGRSPPWLSTLGMPVGELLGDGVEVEAGTPVVTSCALAGTRTGTACEKEALPQSPTTAGTAETRMAAV
jgi:hypothetical protein